MKKYNLILTILLLTVATAFAQDGELTVPLSSPSERSKVHINIHDGSIEVTGTARKDILVKYVNKETGEEEEKIVDGMKRISGTSAGLEVSENKNEVSVESDSWTKGINLFVEIPSNADLEVSTYNNGEIIVRNVNGEIVAQNFNGPITALDIEGSLVADSFNGTIRATFNMVTPDTPMAFTTYNGDVDISVPANFKASLKLKTSQGEIYSGFDFVQSKTAPVTKTDNKSGLFKVTIEDWVRGEVNGGGPEVMMKNYNGNIYIRKM